MVGSKLNSILALRAEHALYSRIGDWYHHLEKFPGILFDANGYLRFDTMQQYESNPFLKRKQDLNIKVGISNLDGYQPFSTEQLELLQKNLPGFDTFSARRKKDHKKKNSFRFKASKPNQLLNIVRQNKKEPRKRVSQIHKQLEHLLYKVLCTKYNAKNIGCDVSTGHGTYIDMAVKTTSGYIFYEIKSFENIRHSIREAYGQLLEYAYWSCDKLPEEMIIVTHKKTEDDVVRYLEFLRRNFAIPIFYQHLDIIEQRLSDKM